jgi:hypothetical protein
VYAARFTHGALPVNRLFVITPNEQTPVTHHAAHIRTQVSLSKARGHEADQQQQCLRYLLFPTQEILSADIQRFAAPACGTAN